MSVASQTLDTFKFGWELLSTDQRRVFKYIQWLKQNFIHAFPSLETIAEKCDCSVRTVSRALRIFRDNEWITRIRRPYQSNLYELPPELISFDTENPDNFKVSSQANVQADVLTDVRVLESSSKDYNTYTSCSVSSSEDQEKEVHIPKAINMRAFSKDEQRYLALRFSERELVIARERAEWYVKQGNRITNFMGYFIAMSKKCRGVFV